MRRWAVHPLVWSLLLVVGAGACASGPRPTPSPARDAGLEPERPGQVDVYVVAVGAFSLQKVFLNEALLAEQRFAARYQSPGRTVLLSSDPRAPARARPATKAALAAALADVAQVMNPDEDVLLLYVAGHGRKDKHIKMRYRKDRRTVVHEDFSADWLAAALDQTGVRRRVVILSACFSGGFIEALAGPDRAVFTAARADRTSFGCEPDARLSYFGRAFLELGLDDDSDLVAAHDRARALIAVWEGGRELVPSEPARGVDPAFVTWLFDEARSARGP